MANDVRDVRAVKRIRGCVRGLESCSGSASCGAEMISHLPGCEDFVEQSHFVEVANHPLSLIKAPTDAILLLAE